MEAVMPPMYLRITLKAAAGGLCAALVVAPVVAEQIGSVSAQSAQRPRIGLVLAGGGAKGGAHVGVLKVLEEQRVPIDCIAGTSMGALIGAGYAAGLPASDLEAFVNGIDWDAVVGGVGRRPLEPIEQKRLKTAGSTAIELGVKHHRIVAPGGLANTSAIDDLLRTYVARARMVADFDQLPIPYRAVATDMVTGRMVVLDRGDLATAMRASMAIPGAFAPVVWDDYILADGGQVRNLPVDVARAVCAEVVIVVNLVEPATPPERLVQATELVARSMEVMLAANENVQLETLSARDVRIDVPMGDISALDFPRVTETVPLGEAAARKVVGELARYSVPPAQYTAWRQSVTQRQGLEARVAEVRIEGLDRVNPEYLRSVTRIRPGDDVSIEAVSADAMRMSALDDVASVAYRLEGDPANPALVWTPQESSVGHDVLRPSMGMYGAGGGDLKFLLGAQYVRHWLNDRGGQWRNNLQLGYETLLTTSLYQPFDVAQRWFVEPGLLFYRSVEDLYVDGEHVAVYRFVDLGGSVDLGVNLGRTAQLRVGYLNTARRSYLDTGVLNLPDVGRRVPEIDARDAGLVASALYDSRDAATFARHGLAAEARYVQSDESLGGDRDWSRIEAGVRKAVPFGKNAIWLSLAGGTDVGGDEMPADRTFSLGGPRTLPAYDFDELRARGYWLADLSVLWSLADLVPVRHQVVYGGFALQAAGLYDRVDRVDDGEVYAISTYVGGATPIGTFTLGVGGATDSWGVWLAIGRPVGKGSILDEGLFR
jgi:NTE family protein